MAEKKRQIKRAREPRTKTRQTAELTKRIEQWSEANGNDAHAETMRQLLGRGSRPKKRKAQRTKTGPFASVHRNESPSR